MNKPCQYTKEDIWNYYSGKLSRRRETEMQEHIISCEACQKMLEQLERLGDIISHEDEEEAEVVDTVQENPAYEIAAHPGNSKTKLVIYIIAAAAAIALIVYLILPKKEVNYPVDKDKQHIYGPGDSGKVDSSYIKSIKVDTLDIDIPDTE